MGARQSAEHKRNNEIDKFIKKEKNFQRKELKVLLLGISFFIRFNSTPYTNCFFVHFRKKNYYR